jgi:response regulator RpfG family c-di-GMP phosphodiesterase/serine/threonine protein kinase
VRTTTVFRSNGSASRHEGNGAAATPGQCLLEELLQTSLILPECWEKLGREQREDLAALPEIEPLLARLVELELLNEYQAARVGAGKAFGLILGNYRVLERIGAGGMGVVFKAEHIRLRRQVAVKVVPTYTQQNDLHFEHESPVLLRFFAEMRAAAQLQHPNIVAAIDVGEVASNLPDEPTLHYFVMEYVPGRDLEEYVRREGPMPQITACDVIHQVASALAEANKHGLIHRDIKPSNILITPEGQAKLLDFGLMRDYRNRMTEPGTVLGTVDYMAPEQARDASAVDIRADIYGLGGTLYWCLTGERPFPAEGNMVQVLARRLTQQPPSIRGRRPDLPAQLETVVTRMMALDPKDRYATPQAVMQALLPLIRGDADAAGRGASGLSRHGTNGPLSPDPSRLARDKRILLADDDRVIRTYCRYVLQAEGLVCDEVENGVQVLEAVQKKDYDLVLLDIEMPEMNGLEALRRLRSETRAHHLKVIMVSGRVSGDEMAQTMLAGADDYLTKPFSVVQLRARLRNALRLKEAQDRFDEATRHLLEVNAELEKSLTVRDGDLVHIRNALVLALAKLVQARDTETPGHLVRLQRYCRALAEEAAATPAYSRAVNEHFIDLLVSCAPLHDIGKVGLPDHILMKPGKLDAEERLLMQAHTTIGSETLKAVAQEYGASVAFLQMGIDIVRNHHERWDGSGYPDRLSGNAIPLAAQILGLADVYDALRSRRPWKPALSHTTAVLAITDGSPGQFDPALLQVFQRCAPQFERIFRECPD